MANAQINALYAGSLRLKSAYFFSEWCVTKVAHCITLTKITFPLIPNIIIMYIIFASIYP